MGVGRVTGARGTWGAALAVLLLSALGGAAPLEGQNCSSVPNLWQFLEQCGKELTGGEPSTLKAALEKAYGNLRDPHTLNSALGKVEGVVPGGLLVKALDLHFVNVQEGENQGMGLRYQWSKSLARTRHVQGTTHWGYDVLAATQGLLTIDTDDNPEELLESQFNPHLFFSLGGQVDSATVAGHLQLIQDSIFAYQQFDRNAPPQLEGLFARIWDGLSTEFYFTAGPEARFESDQTLSQTQWALGGRVGLDLKAWNPDSPLAKMNVFDWPAALLRRLGGMDQTFRPSGSAIPTVLLSWHRVSASANPVREALEGLAPYSRWGAEVNYRSQIAGTESGPIWLEVSYRHHEEVNPSKAVKDAELSAYDRLKLGFFGPHGVGMWWAMGRLPLDTKEADHFGLGFRVRF